MSGLAGAGRRRGGPATGGQSAASGRAWIVRAGIVLGLLAVVLLAWREMRAQRQADAAAETLGQIIDDPSVTTTPEFIHETLAKQPVTTSNAENPQTHEKRLNEVYEWSGVGSTHRLYVTYRIGAQPLLHAYSRTGPVP